MSVYVCLMLFVYESVCVGVCVVGSACVCPLVLSDIKATAVKVKRHSCVCRGESEETFVLLPCSCCCVALLSECAVILGPNVCVHLLVLSGIKATAVKVKRQSYSCHALAVVLYC